MNVVYHLTDRIVKRQLRPDACIRCVKPESVYSTDIIRSLTPIEIMSILSYIAAYNSNEDRSCLIVITLIRDMIKVSNLEQIIDARQDAAPVAASLHTDSDFVALKQTYDRLYDEYTALKATTASLQSKSRDCDMGTPDSCNLRRQSAEATLEKHDQALVFESLNKKFEEIHQEHVRLETANLSLKQQYDDLESKYNVLQHDYEIMLESDDDAARTEYVHRCTIAELNSNMTGTLATIEELRGKLAIIETTYDRTTDSQPYKQLYEKQSKLLAQLSDELQKTTAERDRLGASVSSITPTEVAELNDIIERHEATIAGLHDVIREKNEFIEQQCNNYVIHSTTSDHQIGMLKQDLENALNENVVLSAEIEELNRRWYGSIRRGVSNI